MPTAHSLDATAPEQTRLSARRQGSAKKHAAPYRRAHETSPDCRPAKQEWMGHGRYPILASEHRRPLLFTRTACCLFCAAFWAIKCRICRPACLASHAAFICHLLFALRPYSSRLVFRNIGKPVSSARQDGICNRECGAAPSRRAHEIALRTNPTITGCGKPRDRARPDIEIADVHCFSRALLVALFLTTCFTSRAFESVVRLASSTV